MEQDSTPQEVWKPVHGWEDRYQVSSRGGVRSLDTNFMSKTGIFQPRKGKVLTQHLDDKGYPKVNLFRGGKRGTYYAHLLVAEAFICPRPEGMHVCHNDGNQLDNRPQNLRWDTPSSNMRDKKRHGTCHETNKTHCPRNHSLASWNLVKSAIKRGSRTCLACSRALAYCKKYGLLSQYKDISDRYFADIVRNNQPVSTTERVA